MIDIDNEETMMQFYADMPSVQTRLGNLDDVLRSEGISAAKRDRLAKKLLHMFVPAGTKGAVRGHMFNKIIEKKIRSALTKKHGWRFATEEKHPLFQEIPDWTLRKGRKTLVGFNQVSLFGGGHQINRGGKYIMDDTLHNRLCKKNVRMVCIVNKMPIRKTGKAWDIMSKGMSSKRLFTPNKIKKLVDEFLA